MQDRDDCIQHIRNIWLFLINEWFKHILFRRKGLGVAYNATMPSPEEIFTKEPNHTHTSKNRMFDNTKRNNN